MLEVVLYLLAAVGASGAVSLGFLMVAWMLYAAVRGISLLTNGNGKGFVKRKFQFMEIIWWFEYAAFAVLCLGFCFFLMFSAGQDSSLHVLLFNGNGISDTSGDNSGMIFVAMVSFVFLILICPLIGDKLFCGNAGDA